MSRSGDLPPLGQRALYFDAALARWLTNAQALVDEMFRDEPASRQHTLRVEPFSPVVLRVEMARADGAGRTAWAFVDRRSGDVLAVRAWDAVGEVRSNIFDAEGSIGVLDPEGLGPKWYLDEDGMPL